MHGATGDTHTADTGRGWAPESRRMGGEDACHHAQVVSVGPAALGAAGEALQRDPRRQMYAGRDDAGERDRCPPTATKRGLLLVAGYIHVPKMGSWPQVRQEGLGSSRLALQNLGNPGNPG